MMSKHLRPRSSLRAWLDAGVAILTAAMLFSLPVAVNAQATSGSVRGTVASPDGQPQSGATVTVTDTRTSSVRQGTTDADGVFSVSGLAIGGPFVISVEAEDYKTARVTDVYTSLSEAATFRIVRRG